MGEISVSNSSRHVLEFGNVKVLHDYIELALSSSKTDQTGGVTTIRVQVKVIKLFVHLFY